MPAGRVHEPPDDRQKLVKLINSRDTAIGRRAACFVDRLDLGICSVDERRIGVGGLISLLALCVGVLCCRGVVFGVLCFSPLSRGVSRAPKLPEVGEYSYREKFVARGGGNVGGNGGGNTRVASFGRRHSMRGEPSSAKFEIPMLYLGIFFWRQAAL